VVVDFGQVVENHRKQACFPGKKAEFRGFSAGPILALKFPFSFPK